MSVPADFILFLFFNFLCLEEPQKRKCGPQPQRTSLGRESAYFRICPFHLRWLLDSDQTMIITSCKWKHNFNFGVMKAVEWKGGEIMLCNFRPITVIVRVLMSVSVCDPVALDRWMGDNWMAIGCECNSGVYATKRKWMKKRFKGRGRCGGPFKRLIYWHESFQCDSSMKRVIILGKCPLNRSPI